MTWLKLAGDDQTDTVTYPFPIQYQAKPSGSALWNRSPADLAPRRNGRGISAAGREAELALAAAQRSIDTLTELNDELRVLRFPAFGRSDHTPPPAA